MGIINLAYNNKNNKKALYLNLTDTMLFYYKIKKIFETKT